MSPRRRELAVVPKEAYARRLYVVGLMSAGLTLVQIQQQALERNAEDGGPIPPEDVEQLVRQVWKDWKRSAVEAGSHARDEVLQRIRRDLALMRSAEKVPWAAVARHENLLADIEGTKADKKLKVQHEIGQTFASVIGGMTPEELEALAEEQAELERQAALGRAVLTTGTPVPQHDGK